MKNRQPLFHVVKRESGSPGRQALAYVAAVALAWKNPEFQMSSAATSTAITTPMMV